MLFLFLQRFDDHGRRLDPQGLEHVLLELRAARALTHHWVPPSVSERQLPQGLPWLLVFHRIVEFEVGNALDVGPGEDLLY